MRKHVFTSLARCAALVAATPVMADRDHRHRKHHGHYDAPRKVAYYETHYVPVRPVVRYREVPVRYYAPRPIYVVEEHHHDDAAAKWIGGAILVGAILHHVDHH